MRFSHLLPITHLVARATAQLLYTTSYSGLITTLSLSLSPSSPNTYTLTVLSTSNASSPSPSWLTFSPDGKTLYALDEGLPSPNGSLAHYDIGDAGVLSLKHRIATPNGPVSSALYEWEGGAGLVVANYGGSALSTYASTTDGPQALQDIPLTVPASRPPAPDPAKQSAPRPHQALLDPSGKFVVVPDLGADLVRVYGIEQANGGLEEKAAVEVARGAGPRHGVFVVMAGEVKPGVEEPSGSGSEKTKGGNGKATCAAGSNKRSRRRRSVPSGKGRRHDGPHGDEGSASNASTGPTTGAGSAGPEGRTFFYLLTELSNQLIGYEVSYPGGGGMDFREIFSSSILGDEEAPVGAAASEIAWSQETNTLTTSLRNAPRFTIPHPDSTNSTTIPSDSLQTWSIDTSTGEVKLEDVFAAGGRSPRHFDIRQGQEGEAGGVGEALVAVGLQKDGRVVVVKDAKVLAGVEELGEVTGVWWIS